MSKYPWRTYSPLRTHAFIDAVPLKGADPGTLFTCVSCHRSFKFDAADHRTWAVGNGRKFSPLVESVNRRWLSESCAGAPSKADEEDAKRVRTPLALRGRSRTAAQRTPAAERARR